MLHASYFMRIGVDARVLLRDLYSGIGEYTLRLLHAMAEQGSKHEFHLWVNSFKEPRTPWHETLPANCTLHITRFPNKILTARHRIFGTPLCNALVGGADVWWSPHFLPAPVSCPKVLTVHDLSFLYYPEMFDARRRFWHWMVAPRTQAQSADKVIAVSQSTADDIHEKWHIAPERIATIYSGLGREFSPQNDDERTRVRRAYHLPARFILSLGAREPRKNIAGLVRAYAHFRTLWQGERIGLVLAGSGGWQEHETLRVIRHSSYAADIRTIGFVASQDKPALYAAADCFVYPSFFEGFGFPPLEAMACGTPVIVSHTSSLPEIVQDAGILVDPLRLDEVANAIDAVFSDPSLRADLCAKGLEQAKKFSWGKTAHDTLHTLEQVVHNKV